MPYKHGKFLSFNTQPPEGGWCPECFKKQKAEVSTRSRPKAAGWFYRRYCFHIGVSTRSRPKAAGKDWACLLPNLYVSTRSRPKAAGQLLLLVFVIL